MSKSILEYLKNRQSATLGGRCINYNTNTLEYYNNVRKNTQAIGSHDNKNIIERINQSRFLLLNKDYERVNKKVNNR